MRRLMPIAGASLCLTMLAAAEQPTPTERPTRVAPSPVVLGEHGIPLHRMAALRMRVSQEPLLPMPADQPCEIVYPADFVMPRDAYVPRLWPSGVVPYRFAQDVEEINRVRTVMALEEMESISQLDFIEWTDQVDYIQFQNGGGVNNSPVGQIGGENTINVTAWDSRVVIQHETLHSLGFFHEQSRRDRDQFVQVNLINIVNDNAFNYDVEQSALSDLPYDFQSIMHYGPCFFVSCAGCAADNVGCRTITVLPPNEQFQEAIGASTEMSELDIEMIQLRYGRPTIENDDCINALPVFLATPIDESNDVATTLGNASCGGDGDAFYVHTPTFSDRFTISTCGSDYDTVLSVHSGCPGDEGTQIACSDDNFLLCGPGGGAGVDLDMVQGVSYYIRVAGRDGETGDYRLNIAVTPPDNDDCANAATLFGDAVFAFDNEFATTDGLPDEKCGGNSQQIIKDVWYRWTSASTGNVRLSTCGQASFDTNVAVYRSVGCPSGAETLVCDDDGCGGLQSEVFFSAEQGDAFLIRIGSFEGAEGGQGTFTIETGPPLDNNDCADALPVAGDGTFPFDLAVATTDGEPSPLCDFFPEFDDDQVENDVWYAWTPAFDGTVTIATCDSTVVDTKMALYAGADCATGDPVACSEDGCGLQSTISVDVAAGEQYLIRLGVFPGAAVGQGSFSITTELDPGACCLGSSCEISNERDCGAAGGFYLGDGAVCDFEAAGEPITVDGNIVDIEIGPNPGSDPVVDTVSIPDAPAQIGAVSVVVELGHEFFEDVAIDLTHDASGTTVRLLENACVDEGALDGVITFSDTGEDPSAICFGIAIPVTPAEPLAGFVGLDGDSTWTLTVTDDFLQGGGIFSAWSIEVDGIGESACARPVLLVVDQGGAGDHTTVQDAVDDISFVGGEIIVNPGTYREHVDLTGKSVTIRSMDPSDAMVVESTVLSGDLDNNGTADGRVLTIEDSDGIVLQGLSFTRGDGLSEGGLGHGGAIQMLSGDLTIEDCSFADNEAVAGAAIQFEGNGTLAVARSAFSNNVAVVTGSAINAENFTGDVTIDDSTFRRNAAAVRVIGGTLRASNSLFANAIGAGEALGLEAGSFDLVNLTIANNVGNGIAINSATVTIANTVIWGNTGDAIVQGFGNAPTVSDSIIEGGFAGTNVLDADPRFKVDAIGNGIHDLTGGSPAIDAGDNSAFTGGDVDVAGNARFADDTGVADTGNGTAPIIDLGAYEFQGTTEVNACLCDWNEDEEVSVLDILTFLDGWLADDPSTDVDDSGTVSVTDLLLFLDCYFDTIANAGECL